MKALGVSLVLLGLGTGSVVARAEPAATPDQVFLQAASALERGSFEEAIDLLEALSDRGLVHPDASFDRAVAYLERARSPQTRPGDLGQAAAALSEVLLLRPEDAEAEVALERVRAELGRRRVREGGSPLIARPSLPRAIVGLVGESVWLIIAALGSLLLAVGLGLRGFRARPTLHLSGGVSVTVGLLLLLCGGGLGVLAGAYRRSSEPAVVVVRETRLSGDDGAALPGGANTSVMPEGASVHVIERHGAQSRVEWGTRRGWVPSHELRMLRHP
jgi:hypothetical protein